MLYVIAQKRSEADDFAARARVHPKCYCYVQHAWQIYATSAENCTFVFLETSVKHPDIANIERAVMVAYHRAGLRWGD